MTVAIMRRVVIVALLVGCGAHDDVPDRWHEVERLALPMMPAGTTGTFDAVIANVDTAGNVPEAALDAAIAWAKAGGGLPWRLPKVVDADLIPSWTEQAIRVGLVGDALIERRASDPIALETALYLGKRLRDEGATIIDATIGFQLADRIRALHAGTHPTPAEIEYAPTTAEIVRDLAAEGVTGAAEIAHAAHAAQTDRLLRANRRAYQGYVLDAPTTVGPFLANFDAVDARAKFDDLVAPALSHTVHEMFDQAAAYQAWLASPGAPTAR